MTILSIVASPCEQHSPLRFKNHEELPCHRLPFVDDDDNGMVSFWHVPKSGGFIGGNTTGKALAQIYARYLNESDPNDPSLLQTIALDMFRDGIDNPALRGQAVGFFNELEKWLLAATKNFRGWDHIQSNDALLDMANNGLLFDEKRWLATLEDGE